MENEDKNIIPANTETEHPEKESSTPVNHPSESYYKQMAQYHAGFNTNYITPSDSLDTLYNRTCRLNGLFKALNRPWLSGSGEIQKACAYYLAHAELSKKSREAFIYVLGDIAHSVCYMATCGDFIAQMQRYYHHQEKELKQLLDERKETEQRRNERLDRINEGEVAYCVTIGNSEIYGVTYKQIEELHRTIEIFIAREKTPSDYKIKDRDDDYSIRINKSVSLFGDEDCFHVSYGVDSYETEIQSVSAGLLKKIALGILMFLDKYGENDSRTLPKTENEPEETKSDIHFEIRQDERKPLFKTATYISEDIVQENDGIEISYNVSVNEMYVSTLSFGEFTFLCDKLGDFLKKPVEM